nr:translocation/assembly module TamB domain-containing protein [Saprospiraceae bacterium]
SLILLFVLLVFLIRTPSVQQWIVNKATDYVSETTGTSFSIDKLHLTFKGRLWLEGLYMEDISSDTLMYSESLELGFRISPLFNNTLSFRHFEWNGLTSNVKRTEDGVFNFDFLIGAFDNDEQDPPIDKKPGPVWTIDLSLLDFRNFDLTYVDHYEGMDINVDLNQLKIDVNPFKTDEFNLEFRSIILDGLVFDFLQRNPSELRLSESALAEEEAGSGELFPLKIDLLHLKNISFSMVDSLNDSALQLFLVEHRSQGIELYSISEESLTHYLLAEQSITTGVEFNMVSHSSQVQPEDTIPSEFQWPNWVIQTGEMTFLDQRITIRDKGISPTPGQFNPADLDLQIDSILIPGFVLQNKELKTQIHTLTAREHSGLELVKLEFDLLVTDNLMDLENLFLHSSDSKLEGKVNLSYPGIAEFINQPEEGTIQLDIPQLYLSPLDIARIDPSLLSDSVLGPILKYPVRINTKLSGTTDKLEIQTFAAQFATNTRIRLNGQVRHLTDPDKLSYQLPYVYLNTVGRDLEIFIPPDTTYKIPTTLFLVGNLSGSTNHFDGNLSATIPRGKLQIDGEISDLKTLPVYRAAIVIEELDAAFYIDSLGPERMVGQIDIEGQGFELDQIATQVDLSFSELLYQGNKYSPLKLHAIVVDKNLQFDINIDSEIAKMQMMGLGHLDSTAYSFDVSGYVYHLDLKEMEIDEGELLASAKIKASGSGNKGIFDGRFRLDSIKVTKEEEDYLVDSLVASIFFNSSTSLVNIQSELIRANLVANTSPDNVMDGLWSHIHSYWNPEIQDTVIFEGLETDLVIHVPKTDFLQEIIIPGLEEMEEIHLQVKYRQATKSITGDMQAPYILINGTEIFGLYGEIQSNHDSLRFVTGFDNLLSGPANIKTTRFSGYFADSTLFSIVDLQADTSDQLILMGLQVRNTADSFYVHVEPNDLIFNNLSWKISPENRILWAPEYLEIHDFKVSRNNHSLQLLSHEGRKKDYLKVLFNDISLEGLMAFLNPDENLAGGTMNGFIEADEIFDSPILLLDLEVQDFVALEIPLGELKAKVENPSGNHYTIETIISGGDLDMTGVANIHLDEEVGMTYDADIDLNSMNFTMLERFMEGTIRNSEGTLRGEVVTTGSLDQIDYKGHIDFDDVKFEMTETGSVFTIPSERVDFSQADIVFNKFLIRDNAGNPTEIDGRIDIENLTNPAFALKINSRNFTFIESTRQDNDLFFGKAIADLDIDLRGNLNRPQVNARVDLKSGSEITTIIPESQIQIEEREGVVKIERRVDGRVIVDEDEEEDLTPLFTGVDMEAVIRIDPSVIFRIIIDERAGDQLEVAGEANLSFDMDAQGRMSLSGIYELNRGFYEMRLYEIVRRRFDLQSGSRLIWTGPPMEAEMEITAIHRVRASALDLMADQLAGADDITRTQYRQELPFDVILDLKGTILRPNLAFKLDMPESAQPALGGNVYNRIRQLNTMESEMNTQVFSLLVLGRFLPPGLAAEESRGFDAEGMARSSASSILSGQLNSLSERYIRGVDLDFDLESFTDYQTGTPEERTQLNVRLRRSLLDERLTVEVGGQVDLEGSETEERQRATDILGDVSVEYRLTEDGSWRLRGFRQNQYEGVIEGQVIITGFSLLFHRDFNSLAELFSGKEKKKEND